MFFFFFFNTEFHLKDTLLLLIFAGPDFVIPLAVFYGTKSSLENLL